MLTPHILLGLMLAIGATAVVPTASAAGPCLVGDPSCAVSVTFYVCVTEPCDTATVCVGFGLFCKTI